MNHWKDRIGIIASVICAIHCAATPILLAFLPALAVTEWMASPRFHQMAAVVCVAMVSLAIWPAFRKFRDYKVLSLSTAGLGLLITAAFVLPDECCSHSASSLSRIDPHAGHSHASYDHAGWSKSTSETTLAGHTQISLASVLSPELIALVQPWMTPLGGVLLVIAHGLNLRRRVCKHNRCGCNAQTERLGTVSLISVSTKAA